jgi:hypothetical protein
MGPSGSAAISSLHAEEQIQANISRHVSTANTVHTAVEVDKAVQHGTEAPSLASPSFAPPAYEEIGGVPRTPVVEKLG